MFLVLFWWWLVIGGTRGNGLFEYCLLIIIKAVVVAETGVLETVGVLWPLEDGIKMHGEGELPLSIKAFKEVRWCCDWRVDENFDGRWRSAWDWERPRRTLPGRIFVTIVGLVETDGEMNDWRIWLELVISDAWKHSIIHRNI